MLVFTNYLAPHRSSFNVADQVNAAAQPGGACASMAAQPAANRNPQPPSRAYILLSPEEGAGGGSATGTQPPAQTGNGTGTYQPPTGYSLVSESDLQSYRRHEQSVRGFQPLYERLSKAGIKSVDDWSKYEPDFQALGKKGLKPGSLAAMFGEDADDDLNGKQPKPAQNIDIDQLRKQFEDGAESKIQETLYERDRANDDKIIDHALTKVLGDDPADEWERERTKGYIEAWMWTNRGTYPDGHKLAGRPVLLTQELADKLVKHATDRKAAAVGADKAAKAAEAAKRKPPIGSIGGGGGNSATGKPNTKDLERRPGNKPPRAEVEQAFAELAAKRGR